MKMRIVGLGARVFIQTARDREGNFEQTSMTRDEFEGYMKQNFKGYYSEFIKNGATDAAAFFYHYGETEEMITRGEAFLFTERDDYRFVMKLRIRETLIQHLHETNQYGNLSVIGLLGFCVGYYGQIDAETLEVVHEMQREGAVY